MTEASELELADATGMGCSPIEAVAVGADFGVQDSIEILLDLIAEAIAKGAPRIKLKCCKGWDTNMLDAVRERFPPPIVFHIDCNGGYDLRDPSDHAFLKSLDRYEVSACAFACWVLATARICFTVYACHAILIWSSQVGRAAAGGPYLVCCCVQSSYQAH